MCLVLYPDVGTADEAPYGKQHGERGRKWSLLSISMCPRMLPMCSPVLVCLVCLVLTDRHSSRWGTEQWTTSIEFPVKGRSILTWPKGKDEVCCVSIVAPHTLSPYLALPVSRTWHEALYSAWVMYIMYANWNIMCTMPFSPSLSFSWFPNWVLSCRGSYYVVSAVRCFFYRQSWAGMIYGRSYIYCMDYVGTICRPASLLQFIFLVYYF